MAGFRVYYVYALKDPRTSPARPFYIGKGTGARRYDHLLKQSDRRTSIRIEAIRSSQQEPLVTVLVNGLAEADALRIEAELIAAMGTEDTGGMLTNSVVPSGRAARIRRNLVIPSGAQERAALALNLLKSAVVELAQANPAGVSNADVAQALGLQSDYAGKSINYLSYSLLGLLMREGKMRRDSTSRHIAQVR